MGERHLRKFDITVHQLHDSGCVTIIPSPAEGLVNGMSRGGADIQAPVAGDPGQREKLG